MNYNGKSIKLSTAAERRMQRSENGLIVIFAESLPVQVVEPMVEPFQISFHQTVQTVLCSTAEA